MAKLKVWKKAICQLIVDSNINWTSNFDSFYNELKIAMPGIGKDLARELHTLLHSDWK